MVVLCLAAVAFAAGATFSSAAPASFRSVDCTYANKPIDPTVEALYEYAFQGFQDTPTRKAKWSVTFESLAKLASVASGGADLMEVIVAMRQMEGAISVDNVTISDIKSVWQSTWAKLGATAVARAKRMEEVSNNVSAAAAYMRAWNYLEASETYMDHREPQSLAVYKSAVEYFQTSLRLDPDAPCVAQQIPYHDETGDHTLNSYWCPARSGITGNIPTILAMTGYDASSETTVHEVGIPASKNGYNVMVFEGPGQGSVARFEGLQFRPDWEVVVNQVAEYVEERFGVTPSNMILWGRSFGGYLAPRAFAGNSEYAALVADGGVNDFFQVMACKLPQSLLDLLFYNTTKFNDIMVVARQHALTLDFALNYGAIGFNATAPADLFLATQEYAMTPEVLKAISHRPMLINDPALDFMTGNQSQLFYNSLLEPLSPHTTLLQVPQYDGAALHCGVGSTAVGIEEILHWLWGVIPPASN